jgi:hypothetical protein
MWAQYATVPVGVMRTAVASSCTILHNRHIMRLLAVTSCFICCWKEQSLFTEHELICNKTAVSCLLYRSDAVFEVPVLVQSKHVVASVSMTENLN